MNKQLGCIKYRPSAKKRGQRGFTLLLAALIASIVLALGASIFDIAQKEVELSSIGRNSQFAFYAADTAAECALYWDSRFSYFASTTPAGVNPTCDQQAITPFTVSPSQDQPYTYPYTMTSTQVNLFTDTSTSGGYCAQIIITKSLDPSTGAVVTDIHANGYSVNCASVTTSSDALQRSVELHY